MRLTRTEAGHVTGVVERVRTGLKVRVDGVAAIGSAIEAMIARAPVEDVRDIPDTGGSS